MGTKHTPGPWKVTDSQPRKDGEIHSNILGPNGTRVVSIHHRADKPTTGEADTRLITASPDLLAACKDMLGHIDPCPDDVPMSARCRICGMHPTKHERDCIVLTARAAIARAEGR